jgi:kynurenine 3-monooxygenase
MKTITIVGGGLVGSLLAVLLAKRGHKVDVYERRDDPRKAKPWEGRSINLVVSHRGWAALRLAGLEERVRQFTVPVYARMTHDPRRPHQPTGVQHRPQGQLVREPGGAEQPPAGRGGARAGRHPALRPPLRGRGPGQGRLRFQSERRRSRWLPRPTWYWPAMGPSARCAGSKCSSGRFNYSQEYIEHDYKEISFPARTRKANP